MKIWLFLFVYMGCLVANAQNIYVPGKIAQGETAAYRCKVLGGKVLETQHIPLEVSNVNNVVVTGLEDLSTIIGCNDKMLRITLQEELSDKEWNSIKAQKGHGLILSFIIGKQGEVQNLSFMFWNTDSVFSTFNPDRLYRLEQRFKDVLKQILNNLDKPLKNVIYLQRLDYSDF